MNWLRVKMNEIKEHVLPTVELHSSNSNGIAVALEDVALFVTYICKNSQAVIDRKTPIEKQGVEIVKYGGLEQMVENVGEKKKKSNKCCFFF